jgi:Flp pilus assembly protein TadD
VFIAQRNAEEAEKALRRSVELAPDNTSAYLNLAKLLRSQNQESDAITILNQGLETNPGAPSLTVELGAIYEQQEEFDRAISQYESAHEKHPEAKPIINNLAMLLIAKMRKA